MLCPPHVFLRTRQSSWDRADLEILLGSQQREFEFCYLDAAHFVPSADCALVIGISQRMQQVMARRVRVTLNDRDWPCHGRTIDRAGFGSLRHVTASRQSEDHYRT